MWAWAFSWHSCLDMSEQHSKIPVSLPLDGPRRLTYLSRHDLSLCPVSAVRKTLDQQLTRLFLLLDVPLPFPGNPGLKALLFSWFLKSCYKKLLLSSSFIACEFHPSLLVRSSWVSGSFVWPWVSCTLTSKLSPSRDRHCPECFSYSLGFHVYGAVLANVCHLLVRSLHSRGRPLSWLLTVSYHQMIGQLA